MAIYIYRDCLLAVNYQTKVGWRVELGPWSIYVCYRDDIILLTADGERTHNVLTYTCCYISLP